MQIINEDVDVLIAGGGTAGVIAAIQAARLGVKTCIIEMSGKLGGTITGGGVSAPAYFYSRYKQIIKGIGWELILRNKEFDGIPLPDFAVENPQRPSYHVGLSRYVYALVAEDMCIQDGVDIHYHEIVTGITMHDDMWHIECTGKNLLRRIRAHEVVDATGDADLVGMLGFARIKKEVRQPGTLEFRLSGYDINNLDHPAIQTAYEKAMADGLLQKGDYCFKDRPFRLFLERGGFNMQHIIGADSSDSLTQTEADIRGHQSLLRILRFLKSIKGFENISVEYMGDFTTTRDSFRIVGESTITYNDYITGRKFPDAIAYTLYFIDQHNKDGIKQEFLPYDVIRTLPFSALVPRGSSRILIAGRSISADDLAFSALRVQATCMAMGQAAGAACALAVKQGKPSREIAIEDLCKTLHAHEAIVP